VTGREAGRILWVPKIRRTEMKALKYAQVFAIESRECAACKVETTHWLALQSSNKEFKNARRVRQCERCLLITEAPFGDPILE
jgi:hypothetical protein